MGDQGKDESPAAGPPDGREDAAAPRVETAATDAEPVRLGEHPPASNDELRPPLLDIEVLKRALRAAEEASRAKDLFLATLAHELRTPLQSMLMQAEVLRRAAPQDPVVERA